MESGESGGILGRHTQFGVEVNQGSAVLFFTDAGGQRTIRALEKVVVGIESVSRVSSSVARMDSRLPPDPVEGRCGGNDRVESVWGVVVRTRMTIIVLIDALRWGRTLPPGRSVESRAGPDPVSPRSRW